MTSVADHPGKKGMTNTSRPAPLESPAEFNNSNKTCKQQSSSHHCHRAGHSDEWWGKRRCALTLKRVIWAISHSLSGGGEPSPGKNCSRIEDAVGRWSHQDIARRGNVCGGRRRDGGVCGGLERVIPPISNSLGGGCEQLPREELLRK